MNETKTIPGVKELENEITNGLKLLKNLASRNASKELISYQSKVIRGTMEDLIKLITGEEELKKQ